MKAEQLNIWGAKRLQMTDSMNLFVESVRTYACNYDYWFVAWSAGKDSTTVVTMLVWAIKAGLIPRPKRLVIGYADTRQEIIPLQIAARSIIDHLTELGIEVKEVMAPIEERLLTSMLGRGIPPPQLTFRWCTRQLKVDPMNRCLEELYEQTGAKWLLMTGVRIGESAARDQRISTACTKDGNECGQGWYQLTTPDTFCDKLAPIIHFRVCHVWEWLRHWAPKVEYGDWDTEIIAEAYGGDEAEEINARTGCISCNLVSVDKASLAVSKMHKWSYTAPLLELKLIYSYLSSKSNRVFLNRYNRFGGITIEARKRGFEMVMEIQERVNKQAKVMHMPAIDLLNDEEITYIRKCWDDNVWPKTWNGETETGAAIRDIRYRDGTIQKDLYGE